jgi:hypothetical protein
MDRDAFLAADNGYDDDDAVQAAINTQFNAGFSTFQAAIQSTAADITAMKANVVACPGIEEGDLPGDFGFMYDFSGTQVRWPIPQTVMVNWLATIVQAGGSLTYTRDTLAIPDNLDWIGSCSDASHGNQGDCEGDGDIWTSERNTFSGFDDGTFDAYRGLEEDVRIIEFARWESCDGGGRDQDKAARVLFQQRLEDAMDRIGGTVDGSTAISSAQKEAIIKLLQEPSMD